MLTNTDKVVFCYRKPVIKLFSLGSQEYPCLSEYKGHEMSVTTVGSSNDKVHLASGSRDQTTRLWDVETCQQLQSRKIDRNAITYIKWLPNNSDLFIECSEDLTLRLWDIK
jgi:WD40 repeat protein